MVSCSKCTLPYLECTLDSNANVLIIDSHIIKAGFDIPAMVTPVGKWHKLVCLESGSVLLTVKDGQYEPLKEDNILLK